MASLLRFFFYILIRFTGLVQSLFEYKVIEKDKFPNYHFAIFQKDEHYSPNGRNSLYEEGFRGTPNVQLMLVNSFK